MQSHMFSIWANLENTRSPTKSKLRLEVTYPTTADIRLHEDNCRLIFTNVNIDDETFTMLVAAIRMKLPMGILADYLDDHREGWAMTTNTHKGWDDIMQFMRNWISPSKES